MANNNDVCTPKQNATKSTDSQTHTKSDLLPCKPPRNRDQKHEQAALVRTIGARMREARDLCNMSQIVAAEELGYANSSKLAKIEGATDTNSVPMYIVLRAAKLYDVSTDFLFGLTDDWEREGGMFEGRETFGYIMACRAEDRKRDDELFGRLANQIRAVSGIVTDMGPIFDLLERGVGKAKNDPSFDEVSGGAAILSASDRLIGSFKGAMVAFRKLKLDLAGYKEGPPLSTIASSGDRLL